MRFLLWLLLAIVAGSGSACQKKETESTHSAAEDAHESWAVTAWGDRYEIFAEADPLAVGSISKSHTHVTILDGFAPLKEGVVDAVLRNERGEEEVFRQEKALRDGIFSIEIKPARAGNFDLFFRVQSAAGPEELPAGRASVGTAEAPGGMIEPPRYAPGPAAVTAEETSFLKEQQWRTAFATEWTRRGTVHRTASGPGRIRPAAGGEVMLSAPLDGVVAGPSGAFVGQAVSQGSVVIQLRPRVGSDRSVAQIRSELELAESRLGRLEELISYEAVSQADLEAARSRVEALKSEIKALAGEGPTVSVRAPFGARIAEILVIPGQSVAAGTPLVRIVREEPVWVEVSLRPADATAIDRGLAGLVLRPAGSVDAYKFERDDIRLISMAPEVSRTTGSVAALLELSASRSLRPGMAVDAEILLPEELPGIVVPATAVVDDGGVPIVYLQLGGENFARQEVRVVVTQADQVLIEGLSEWSRVVTIGGAAIRRAALLQTGPPEGHAH